MLIRLGYDMEFYCPFPVAMVAMLHVHASRVPDLREPDELRTEPNIATERYRDAFGNCCTRFFAPRGNLRLWNMTTLEDSGLPDVVQADAKQHPVQDLPAETLQFLVSSRYCEVDRLGAVAYELFGHTAPGWGRVQAICDWVHQKVEFGYQYARPTKTAIDVFIERKGVCRDYQHLAISFCRAMNIPARYATGYLGDIGVPLRLPMDFSAWFEVFLDGRWWAFDARNNMPRIGRILMAVGRDASDVAITTSFGQADLINFHVTSDEIAEPGS